MKRNDLDLHSTIRAHDSSLSALVSQRLNIPRFVCLLPLKQDLKDWYSNPTTMLFSNTAMLVVVCPVTLKVVPRAEDGERNLYSNIIMCQIDQHSLYVQLCSIPSKILDG